MTGAAQGLGLAMAIGLAEAGARVALNDRQETRLCGEVARLTEAGHTVRAAPFDVSDSAQVQVHVPAIEREFGPIDILVNNAGIHRRGPIEDLPEAAWREVLDTNLTAAFLMAQQVAPGMVERRSGKIINICIQVNGIGPGWMATELNRPLMENPVLGAWVRSRVPAGRYGDPAEMAGVVVYLASRASDLVTGQVVSLDGGTLAAL